MRTLGGLFLVLLFVGGLFAQGRGGSQPVVVGGPGNAVFPGGTPANNPGLTRVNPGVAYPGGGGPRLMVPGTTTHHQRSGYPGTSYVYAYPIYVPFYDLPGDVQTAPAPAAPPAAPGQPAPPVVVIYATQPAPPPAETARPSIQVFEPAAPPEQAAEETPAATSYLFAFKDHSVYSAVAYWVDGGTLHFFVTGDTHKQAPLSTLDRDLTERLNHESGVKLKLPPADK